MRVFVTGASGWLGSAVVPELREAGHQVAGLARSDASTAALESAGAEVVRGTLDDLDTLRSAAAAADGVIHLAFKHDLMLTGDMKTAVNDDRAAIKAIGETLAGSDRPFVVTGGTPAEHGRAATERDGHPVDPAQGDPKERSTAVEWALGLADRGVRSSAMRIPRSAHGEGDPGFIAMLVGIARGKGAAGYVGDGSSRWPAVHRLDAARLYRLALESAPAGTTLHAVGDEGVALRDIAEVIGRHLDLPVAPVPTEDATEHFGWLGGLVGTDQPASAELTRELMGWRPAHPGLIEDLDKGHYFGTGAA
ncbi:SDR family oxidoreductase [Streptomonospora sediminis]